MPPKALVFDAYGTLFDVRSVLSRCEEVFPGQGQEITTLWRVKQLEYSWLRSLMGRYEDFWRLTEDGLRWACLAVGLSPTEAQLEQVLQSYLTISPFPDTLPALAKLTKLGLPLAILSNGSPAMLEAAVTNAALTGTIAHVISVDEVKIFKPHPSVYALAPARLGLAKEEIAFVSSNGWDAAGAKAFGFEVYWINRMAAPIEELSSPPNAVIASLLELAELLS